MSDKTSHNRLINWLKLILGFGLIWLGITQFHKLIPGKTAHKVIEHIQKEDLDAGALFYSESPDALDAYYHIKKKYGSQSNNK